ncbi:MAG: helix-turn-helix transcriptional regulator [Kofleriaceae bacterium]
MRVRYKEAAAHVGIPIGTLRRLVHEKKVPHYQVAPRTVLFDPAELDEWVASAKVAVSK